jgi:hypothetical protein
VRALQQLHRIWPRQPVRDHHLVRHAREHSCLVLCVHQLLRVLQEVWAILSTQQGVHQLLVPRRQLARSQPVELDVGGLQRA